MSDFIIRVENLGKKYKIRHQQDRQRYVALRDVIAEKAAAPLRWLRQHGAWSMGHGATDKHGAQSMEHGVASNGGPSPDSQLSVPSSELVAPDFSLPASGSELVAPHSMLPAPRSAPSPLPLSPLQREEEFWALRGVTFEVKQGEVLGIIGRNGAGKTTLLKILSRITEPTEGRVRIRGRVASLLEVGTGFHPELTGRENIFLNGAILGMSREEIKRKFDEIVDFSGVEKFIDTPVKRYSSGMYVRLAFAVAAHLEPEILIVDEVLAVGDFEFQKKCLRKMDDVAKRGRTVLMVTHNIQAVRNLCSRVILLTSGRLVNDDGPDDAIALYLQNGDLVVPEQWIRADPIGDAPLAIMRIVAKLLGRQPTHRLSVTVELRSLELHQAAFMAVDFFDSSGNWLMQAIPSLANFIQAKVGDQVVHVEVELPPLIPGFYRIGIWIGLGFSTTLDEVREAVGFYVADSPTFGRFAPHQSARGYIVPISRVLSVSPDDELVQ